MLSKQNIQDKSQVIFNISYLGILFQNLHGFSKKAGQNGSIQWLTVNS